MLFGPSPKISYFNELEINGEHVDDGDNEDFTNTRQEDDDTGETTPDTDDGSTDEGTDDNLEDFTEDDFDDGDPGEDDDPTEGEENNNEQTDEDTDPENAEGNDDTEGDNADEAEDNGDDTEGTDDNLEDFTEDDFDSESDGDTEDPESDGSAENDDNTDEGNSDNEPENGKTDNALSGMEKNLFSDLTPQQMAIKNNELLQNYIELYDTLNTIFDSINKIPKTFDNTRPLTFIADQLVDLKDMVNYVITDTYVTKTYVENMAYYKQALVVMSQLNTMLKALIQKPAK